MTGAAVVFFAYIGFDAVSTTAEEAKNPSRDLPIGIIASLVICTVLYLAVAAILTGIVPVVQYKSDAQFLNAPVGYALAVINKDWAAGLVSAGAVAGITSVLLVMLMSQPRIFFSMSRDRLLPRRRQQGAPALPHALHHHDHHRASSSRSSPASCRFRVLGEMTSIGTLFAFVVVSLAVIVLRVKRPDAQRPFRVPFGPVIPVLGVLSCVYLMVSLSVMTWVRFLVLARHRDDDLLVLRPHAQPAGRTARRARARTARENLANFLKMAGYMLLFNGFCITLLAFLTDWGVTTEELAKWRELDGVLSHVGHAHQPGDRRRFRPEDPHRRRGRRWRSGSCVARSSKTR